MNDSKVRERSRLVRHVGVHVVLMLLFFLPGGLIWNRLDPEILGLPFSAFAVMLFIPLLIIINMIIYVRSSWADDLAVSSELRAGASIQEARRPADPDDPPRDLSGGTAR